ncbi:MAG: DUF3472 domain-containing protein [Pseudomonadota bacterium]
MSRRPPSRLARAALVWLAAALLLGAPGPQALARQGASKAGAPSVHVRYEPSDVSTFYSEVTVKRSAPGSYFAVTGWHNGYFGLQERADGRKVLIFSVWGSKSDAPAAGGASVLLVSKDPAMRIAKFGNEGSGLQSFLDFDWKINTSYAFMVKARLVDERAEYTAYFRSPDAKWWRPLATMSTPFEATLLRGLHSFAEDFRRDDSSAKEVRRAMFSNAWARKQDGSTIRLLSALVTCTPQGARAVDAEVSAAGITIASGGATENVTTSLGRPLLRAQSINDDLPGDL